MSREDQASLRHLVLKRGQAKATCTRAKTYIESFIERQTSAFELKHRKEKFEECWNSFSAAQEQIELIQEGSEFLHAHESERIEFEQQYFYVLEKFEEAMEQVASQTSSVSPRTGQSISNDETSLHAQIRLPRIDLPKFSGAYEEWFPFHDTFNALIHSDPRLKNIQKFQYLKSALQDEAAALIKSFEISDLNYIEAWNTLKGRYDNKRAIVQKHVKSLFDLLPLQRENCSGLRQLVDGALKHLRALKALGRPAGASDDLIMWLVTSKLDNVTRKAWEVSISGTELPAFSELIEFLSRRCHALEAFDKDTQDTRTSNKSTRNKAAFSHVSISNKSACLICKGNHYLYQCGTFLKLTVDDRIKRATALKLCLNCLRTTAHRAKACDWGCCKKCGKRHSTLLHKAETTSNDNTAAADEDEAAGSRSGLAKSANITQKAPLTTRSDTLLSSAVVRVKDRWGKMQQCRAFLDSGSQSNFVTDKLLGKLGLKTRPTNIPVLGFRQGRTQIRRRAEVEVASRINGFSTRLDCLVVDNITADLPLESFNRDLVEVPRNIPLADPSFNVSAEVDILIGVDTFWKLLCVGQIRTAESQPILQKTQLGWIIAGDFSRSASENGTTCCSIVQHDNIESLLTRFWELDQGPSKVEFSRDERHCIEHYMSTYQRNGDGRFIVNLPAHNERLEQLGPSRDIAVRRFHALERRLGKEPQLKAEYVQFMREYEQLGHMRLLNTQELEARPNFYLPHHAVLKATSLTTKLRVVFDASCKTRAGISLNDVLMVGPTLQQDLFSILIRFRTYFYALSADIAKMYRQVLLHPTQTPLQRIVWRETTQEALRDYELLTVTYGTAPAAFLATKTLHQLATLGEQEYPIGSVVARRDFYVDDLLTGANSLEEATSLRNEVIKLLSSAGFELRKWLSNEPQLLIDLPIKTGEHSVLQLDKGEVASTLGIRWDARQDVFQYNTMNMRNESKRVTKRSILSSIARVFDPLGLMGPIMLSAKIIMQRLWVLKVHWDETVPAEIDTAWKHLEAEWNELGTISIPRKVVPMSKARDLQMHGFSDASQNGYGACIYIRSTDLKGGHHVRLICSKSRVAPLRNVSLPRLERCGALLLAELGAIVLKAMPFNIENVHYWTDSGIVLGWIHSPSRRWVTFVANRVGTIQELSGKAKWSHVSGKENPADLISRGTTPVALKES